MKIHMHLPMDNQAIWGGGEAQWLPSGRDAEGSGGQVRGGQAFHGVPWGEGVFEIFSSYYKFKKFTKT